MRLERLVLLLSRRLEESQADIHLDPQKHGFYSEYANYTRPQNWSQHPELESYSFILALSCGPATRFRSHLPVWHF